MGDPLSDPRATALLAADPGEVGSLASAFGHVASQAQTASSALRGAQGDATWTGQAADAFRTQLGKLPGDLDKVQHSYSQAAGALTGYEPQLSALQRQFQALSEQLQTAQANLQTAHNQQAGAQQAYTQAAQAPKATATTPAVVNANQTLQTATTAVGNLQDQVTGLQSRGYQLLDEFDTARGHARATISSAAGIAPSQSWLSGVLGSIGNFMSGVGHALGSLAMAVVHSAEDLPSDIANVVEHPTDLHDWGKLAEDVGTVAGAVALVAAIAICPADALGLDAAVGAFEAVEGTADTVATISMWSKAGADTGDAIEGKGSWGTVVEDGAMLGMPGGGDGEGAASHALTDEGGNATENEGATVSGTNARGEVTARGSFRVGTTRDTWADAPEGPDGGRLCRTCGTEVFQRSEYDISHYPSWTNREFPPDVTRKEVLDNYQQGTYLECRHCNRSAGNDDSRFGEWGLP